jgi:hypothetical protein
MKRARARDDRGMDDRLQRGELVAVAEHPRRQGVAIDRAVARRPGKARFDDRHQPPAAALQRADLGIGVEKSESRPRRTSPRRSTCPCRSIR